MLSIPLYSFLLLYWLFVLVFIGFMLVNLYHIVATASFTLPSFLFTFFIFAGTALILYFTYSVLHAQGIDWQQQVALFNFDWISGAFTNDPF